MLWLIGFWTLSHRGQGKEKKITFNPFQARHTERFLGKSDQIPTMWMPWRTEVLHNFWYGADFSRFPQCGKSLWPPFDGYWSANRQEWCRLPKIHWPPCICQWVCPGIHWQCSSNPSTLFYGEVNPTCHGYCPCCQKSWRLGGNWVQLCNHDWWKNHPHPHDICLLITSHCVPLVLAQYHI